MLEVQLLSQPTVYAPGEFIAGFVAWDELPSESPTLSIRLIWYTSGKGTRDYCTESSLEHSSIVDAGRQAFEFVAPHRPLSFSGKLISLQWAVEAVLLPTKESARAEFAISTMGKAIELQEIPDAASKIAGHGKGFSFVRFGR